MQHKMTAYVLVSMGILCVPLERMHEFSIFEYAKNNKIMAYVNNTSGKAEIVYFWSTSKPTVRSFLDCRDKKLFKTRAIEFTPDNFKHFKDTYYYGEIIDAEIMTKKMKRKKIFITYYEDDTIYQSGFKSIFEIDANYLPNPNIFTEEIYESLNLLNYPDFYDVVYFGLPYDMLFENIMIDTISIFVKEFGVTIKKEK